MDFESATLYPIVIFGQCASNWRFSETFLLRKMYGSPGADADGLSGLTLNSTKKKISTENTVIYGFKGTFVVLPPYLV